LFQIRRCQNAYQGCRRLSLGTLLSELLERLLDTYISLLRRVPGIIFLMSLNSLEHGYP